MGLLGGLLGGWQQARDYKGKARLAQARGRAQRSEAYAKATAAEVAARQNAQLAGLNLQRLRSNQQQQLGAVRVSRAGAGFDLSSGSGGAAEDALRRAGNLQVADAALGSSVEQLNAFNQAVGLRRQGDAAMRAAEAEAEQFRVAARATRQGMLVAAIPAVAGAVAGGLSGGFGGAFNGANAGFSMGAAVNPFLSQYADKDWEQTLLGLLRGSDNVYMPGFK